MGDKEALIERLETTCLGLDAIDPLRLLVDDVVAALREPEQEPDDLTIAYMSGLHDGKKKRPWVGLTAEEAAECWTTSATQTWKNFEAKLKEKNT
jgi:hypothetical protein